jgi:hypothetical protein
MFANAYIDSFLDGDADLGKFMDGMLKHSEHRPDWRLHSFRCVKDKVQITYFMSTEPLKDETGTCLVVSNVCRHPSYRGKENEPPDLQTPETCKSKLLWERVLQKTCEDPGNRVTSFVLLVDKKGENNAVGGKLIALYESWGWKTVEGDPEDIIKTILTIDPGEETEKVILMEYKPDQRDAKKRKRIEGGGGSVLDLSFAVPIALAAALISSLISSLV